MTVAELIDVLESYDPEARVYLSKDEEGNGFSLLYEVGASEDLGDEDEVPRGGIILWP